MTKLLVVAFAMIVLAPEAFACTCRESYRPMSYIMEKSQGAFVGKIVSVTSIRRTTDSGPYDLLTTFRVERVFKGLPEPTRLISLKTNYDATSCGYRVDDKPKPTLGKTWIAFARRWDGEPQLALEGTCDGSGPISGKEERKYIEEQLGLKINRPAIALRMTKDFVPIKDSEVVVKGNGIEKRIRAADYDWLLVDGLSPGKYVAEFTVTYETVEALDELTLPDLEVKVTRLGERLWRLTYAFEVNEGDYKYKQVKLR